MSNILGKSWAYLKRLNSSIGKDRVSTWAAAISFYVMLCAFPLLLLAVAAAAQFLGSSDTALHKVMGLVSGASPSSVDLVQGILQELIKSRGALGLIGALALLWTGSQLNVTLEAALNAAWGAPPRPYWESRLLALGFVVLLLALGLSSLGLSWVMAALRGTDLLGLGRQQWLWSVAGLLLPLLLSFALFLLIYKILPNIRVSWKTAALGAAFAALAWELAKQAFGFYLNRFANYASLYGSLAGIIILVVWVYYSAMIILIGAEIACLARGKQAASAAQPSRAAKRAA